jgi:hypothetical protein
MAGPSREEASALLRNLQLSLDALQRKIDDGVRGLDSVRRDELPGWLLEQRRLIEESFEEQLQEFDRFVASTGLQVLGALPRG